MQTASEVKLGCTYKDVVHGIQGVATGVVTYLTGCDQVLIASANKEKDEIKSNWFDVSRVELVDTVLRIEIPEAVVAPGGPQAHPPPTY